MTNFPDILTRFVKDLSDRAYIVGICRATTEIIPESKSWDALEWFDFITERQIFDYTGILEKTVSSNGTKFLQEPNNM